MPHLTLSRTIRTKSIVAPSARIFHAFTSGERPRADTSKHPLARSVLSKGRSCQLEFPIPKQPGMEIWQYDQTVTLPHSLSFEWL